MNREQLVQLAYHAHLTPRQLKARDPALHKALAAAASEDLRAALRDRLADGSEGLRSALEHIEIPMATRKGVRPRDLVIGGLKKAGASADLVAEAERQISDLNLDVAGFDKSGGDEPVARNPVLNGRVRQGQMLALGGLARLAGAKLDKLLEHGGGPLQIDSVTLNGMLEEGNLSRAQAGRLGLQTSLFAVLDENLSLVAKVNEKGVRRPGDLVRVGKDGWADLLRETETEPPAGLSRGDHAAVLDKRIKLIFPAIGIAAQREPMPSSELRNRLQALRPLAARNPRLFTAPQFSKLEVSGIPLRELAALRGHYRRVKAYIGAYPGQQLPELLDDPKGSLDDKVRVVKARTDAARAFFKGNAEQDWLTYDLSEGSDDLAKIDMENVPDSERAGVLETARRYQLVHSITPDPDDMGRVLAAGYSSAHGIVSGGYERFQASTEFEAPKAVRTFAEAMHAMSATTAMIGSMIDVLKGGFNATAVGNLAPSVREHIMGIRGYESLFGNQDFCACEHCNSILGPAAYFVDLMQFIEQHVLGPSFDPHPPNQPLHLKTRRPDLWTLELSCANTNTPVPSLAVINRILEGYIAAQQLGGDAGDGQIHDFVYRDALPDAVGSFGLPFHLPLARIDTYLEHFQRTRADVARTIESGARVYSMARLGLSPQVFQLITSPSTAPSFLRDLFEVDFRAAGGSGRYRPFDAQLLVKSMGVSRAELGALIRSRFVTDDGANPIRIVGEKRTADSVQIDIENVRDAEPRSLDRLHRLARVVPALPWSAEETDFLLGRLREAGLPGDLGEESLANLVDAIEISEAFQQTLEELCVAWGEIPDEPLDADGHALFDRLFNARDVVRLDGAYPKDDENFLHPALGGATTPALPRLLGGLRTGDDGLYALITHLGDDLAPARSGDEGFALSRRNLSLLYRHARWAEHFKLSVDQLFQLIALWRAGAASHIAGLDDLKDLIAFHGWWTETRFSLDDLSFVTGAPPRDPSAYPAGAAAAESLLESLESDRPSISSTRCSHSPRASRKSSPGP